jgi:hypothetical protein
MIFYPVFPAEKKETGNNLSGGEDFNPLSKAVPTLRDHTDNGPFLDQKVS